MTAWECLTVITCICNDTLTGADPGFQVRGGGAHLKKIAPSGGRRENFWGISCEKSLFYAKKSYFFQYLSPIYMMEILRIYTPYEVTYISCRIEHKLS